MEYPSVSRFNSQSTSRTFVGSDSGLASPTSQSYDGGGPLEIVQTPDNKKWIDLGELPPKILKELKRQYGPSIKDEPAGALAKGAAKVKTWIRGSKGGINIRFRHQLGPDTDEVTDVVLTPHHWKSTGDWRDEKQPLIAELPAISSAIAELPGEITEMPDTSISTELSGISIPSRSSTDSTLGEPLPRYEPRSGDDESDMPAFGTNMRAQSPERIAPVSHAHSPSQDSIVRTPTDGLAVSSLEWPQGKDSQPVGNIADGSISDQEVDKTATFVNIPIDEKMQLDDVEQQNTGDDEIFKELQDVIQRLRRQQSSSSSKGANHRAGEEEQTSQKHQMFGNLKVAKTATYETETDAEPPSPMRRRTVKPARNKSVAMPKRRKSLLTPKRAVKIDSDDPYEEPDQEHDSLLRKPTLPKRAPVSAGAEVVWSSLLQMQAKILGPEHPLVYQAKSDLARSRANGHLKGSEDLDAFRQSKQRASETLGDVHPWVAAFSEDLSRLERILRTPGKASSSRVSGIESEVTAQSPSQVLAAEQAFEYPSPAREHAEVMLAESSTANMLSTKSKEPTMAPSQIVTSFEDSAEPSYSPGRNSSLQPPSADVLWSSSRPPHEPRSAHSILPSIVIGAFAKAALNGISWIQRNYGPEQPVEPGKVRVRWTCSCGAQLHDDFIERRPGAARELERYLNRPRTVTAGNGTPTSPSSSMGSRSFTGSTIGGPPSSQTSWSSYNFPTQGSSSYNGNEKPPQTHTGASMYPGYNPLPEPPWLLTCANEDRFTPKLAHLDMAPHKIRSDKDLALSLRDHYFNVNKKWWRALRMRGLTTIEFVQFEVHQNRFADIRKRNDMPPLAIGDYNFEPTDLLPPVSRSRIRLLLGTKKLISVASAGWQYISSPSLQASRRL